MPIADRSAPLQGLGIINKNQFINIMHISLALQGHNLSAMGIALRRQDKFRTHKDYKPIAMAEIFSSYQNTIANFKNPPFIPVNSRYPPHIFRLL